MSFYQPINTGVADDEFDPSSPVPQSCFDSSSISASSDENGDKEAFSPPSSPPAFSSPDKGKAPSPAHILSSPPAPPRSPFRPSTLSSRIAQFEANAQTASGFKAKAARRDVPVYNPLCADLEAESRPQTPAPIRGHSETLFGSPGPSEWTTPGPSRRQLRVPSEAQEGPEGDESPHGVLGRLPSWEISGIAKRTSLAMPTEEEEAENRAHWAGVQEAGDRFLRGHERDPKYPRCNSRFSFFPSFVPTGGERTDLLENVIPVPGREEVVQLSLNDRPTYRTSGVFFDRTVLLNEEFSRLALCIDDPDAGPAPVPSVDKRKDIKPSLLESLKTKLPSPGNFTTVMTGPTHSAKEPSHLFATATYQSKRHKHSDIVSVIGVSDEAIADKPLKARASRYSENKSIIDAAFKSKKKLGKRPAVAKCEHCRDHSCVHGGHTPIETELQTELLHVWELQRDIERLGALERNVRSARIMASKNPLFVSHRHSCMIREDGIAPSPFKMENGELVEEDDRTVEREDEVESSKAPESVNELINAVPPPGTQLRQSYENMLGTISLGAVYTSAAASHSSNGEPFRYDEMERPQDVEYQRSQSSSVYGNHGPISRSDAPTPNDESHNRHRADAHAVMSRLGAVSISIRGISTTSARASIDNRSANSERSQQGVRTEDGGVQNTRMPGDGHFPTFRTFVQQ